MNKASSGNVQIEPIDKGPGKLGRIGQSCKTLFCCIFMIGVILNLALTGILLFGYENYHQVDHVKLYEIFESPKYVEINQLLDSEKYLVLYGESGSGIINFVEHEANIRSQQGVPVIMRDLQQSFIQKHVKQTKHFIELYLGQVGRGKHSWFILLNNTETPQNQIQSIQKKYPHDSIVLIAHQQSEIDGFNNHKFPVLSSGQLRQFMQKDLEMDKKQIKQIFKNAQDKTAASVFEAYKNNQQEKIKAAQAKQAAQAAQAAATANPEQVQTAQENQQDKENNKDKKKDSKKGKKEKQTKKINKKGKKAEQVIEEDEQEPVKKDKKTDKKTKTQKKDDKKQNKKEDKKENKKENKKEKVKKEKSEKIEKKDKKQKKVEKKEGKIVQQKQQKKQKSDDKKKEKKVDKKQQIKQVPQPVKQNSAKPKKQKKPKSQLIQPIPVETATINTQQVPTQQNGNIAETILTLESSDNSVVQPVQGSGIPEQKQAVVQVSL